MADLSYASADSGAGAFVKVLDEAQRELHYVIEADAKAGWYRHHAMENGRPMIEGGDFKIITTHAPISLKLRGDAPWWALPYLQERAEAREHSSHGGHL